MRYLKGNALIRETLLAMKGVKRVVVHDEEIEIEFDDDIQAADQTAVDSEISALGYTKTI